MELIIILAIAVVSGSIKLSVIRDLFGSDTAALVHTETNIRSWQIVSWVRRVR